MWTDEDDSGVDLCLCLCFVCLESRPAAELKASSDVPTPANHSQPADRSHKIKAVIDVTAQTKQMKAIKTDQKWHLNKREGWANTRKRSAGRQGPGCVL